MIAEFLHVADQRWYRFLSRTRHDFYHLPKYVDLVAKHEGGIPTAFYAAHGNAAFLAPLILRHLPMGLDSGGYDGVSPYGYSAPLLTPSSDDAFCKRALTAFRDFACRRGIVTAFFRLHPLIKLPLEALSEFGSVVKHGETVFVNLGLSEQAIRSQFRRGHNKTIVKLQKSGFSTCMDDWSLLEEFHAIYMQTVARVRAHSYYWFSLDYLRELRKSLNSCVHLCAVITPQRTLSSAVLFITCQELVQLHLIATANHFLRMSPAKLAIQSICQWAKERDYSILHLGGGVGGRQDSLFHFKAGFSDARTTFCTYRMVLDEAKYGALVSQWKDHYGLLDEIHDEYFPMYRSHQKYQMAVSGDAFPVCLRPKLA